MTDKKWTLLTRVLYRRQKNAKVYIYRYINTETGAITFWVKQRMFSNPEELKVEEEHSFKPLCTKFGKTLIQKDFLISEESLEFLSAIQERPIWDYANKMFNYEKITGSPNEENINKRRDTRRSIIST